MTETHLLIKCCTFHQELLLEGEIWHFQIIQDFFLKQKSGMFDENWDNIDRLTSCTQI